MFIRRVAHFLIFTSMTVSVSGCGQNLLAEFGAKDSEAAIIFEAKQLTNEGNWTGAINKLETLPSASLANRNINQLRASFYSGRCGLDMISFISSLAAISSSNSLLMILLSKQAADPNYLDCVRAEDLLQSAANDATERTEGENLLMAFTSMAKIGAIVADQADTNDDGAADAGYSACGMSNDLTNQMVVGFSLASRSLAQTTVGSGTSGAFGLICGSTTFCDNFETSDVDPLERAIMRTAIHQNGDLGLHTSNGTLCP